MADFKFNEDGMRKLEEEVKRKTNAAVQRGEKAAEGQGPDAVADAVAAELKRIGVQPNVEAIRAKYREVLGEG